MCDSIKFDKSFVDKWQSSSTFDEQVIDLKKLVAHYSPLFSFTGVSCETKTAFCLFVLHNFNTESSTDLKKFQLEFLKILFRDKLAADLSCYIEISELLARTAGLLAPNLVLNKNIELFAAEKCLINLAYNSLNSRNFLEKEVLDNLLNRLSALQKCFINDVEDKDFLANYDYFKTLSADNLNELCFLDLRIAFVTSAQMLSIQQNWLSNTVKTNVLLNTLSHATNNILFKKTFFVNNLSESIDCKIANETLKILFNIYCHGKMFDLDVASKCGAICAKIIKAEVFDFTLKQSAINLLAIIPLILSDLCPKLSADQLKNQKVEVYEECDIEFASATLVVFETAINKLLTNELQLLGTFFTVLINLCVHNKAVRRFCRLKIIPPLTAKDVDHPPCLGNKLRNKIIRLMQTPSTLNALAAELLFVLCKQSVSRMIKYCGFGHSAGLLANYGFLSAETVSQKSASDSEDSETEDYKEVEKKVNPVTGFIPSQKQLEEFKQTIESMSEKQKEYEAMKLANALDKLMDGGVFAPATIGADGRPKQMSHVLELLKDVKIDKKNDANSD